MDNEMRYAVLIDAEGNETSLTKLNYTSYSSDWGTVHVNRNVEGGTLRVDGQSYTTGLGLNAKCTLVYDLPEGHNYKTFRALCGYDSSCDSDNPNSTGTTMEFLFYVMKKEAYTFDLTQLGYTASEAVPVHDIWGQEDLGSVTGTLTTSVPSHGVRLFRLGDKASTGIRNIGQAAQDGMSGAGTGVYDLQGRRLQSPHPGLNIIDGKKVLVK